MHGQAASSIFPHELRAAASIKVPEWEAHQCGPAEFAAETKADGGFDDDGTTLLQPSFRWLDRLVPIGRIGYPYGFGIDLGAGAGGRSNTVIVAFYHDPLAGYDPRGGHSNENMRTPLHRESPTGSWVWQWVLTLRGWANSVWQTAVIHHLMERYKPSFVGMDYSTLGQGFVDSLRTAPQYSLSYGKAGEVVWGFHSTEVITWGTQTDPLGNEVPIRQRLNAWATSDIRQQLFDRSILLPTIEQAPEVHQDLSTITMTVVSDKLGGTHLEFGPRHPHLMDALRQWAGARRQWELRAAKPVIGRRASSRDIDRILTLAGPGLFD